jgi:choline dehydrogenase-like flavoprotein
MPDSGHTDVLIIGAGAGGGVSAARLIEAGISVTCLEQGDWHLGRGGITLIE